MSNPLKVFITYSHKDLQRNTELKMRLAVMEAEGKIELWDDNKILPGDEWEKDISENLGESDILLYLVSATSLASKNCNKELAEVLSPNIRVIPVVLEACDWENHQLSCFEALPHKGKPINEWRPQSKGWQNVVEGIRKVVDAMQSQVDSPPGMPEEELRVESAFQQGNVLMMLKQTDEAIERYSHAIKLSPNNAAAYSNRGLAYSTKGKYDRAIGDFNKAIQLKLDYAEAYNNRGIACHGKGNFDRAIGDFNKAIQLKPDYAEAYTNRGMIYRDRGDYDRAIEDCNMAIELRPKFAEAYSNRGVAYSEKGNSDRAIVDYNTAIDLKPDYAEAYSNRGNAYHDRGDSDRAIVDHTQAIQLKPDSAISYYNCGNAYHDKGDYNRAIENFNTAIYWEPNFAFPYFNRGRVWLYLREWENAKTDLMTAKEKGIDIITTFSNNYGSVRDFEQRNGIQLPEDIAAMLTPSQ